MPLLYRGRCEACGHATGLFPGSGVALRGDGGTLRILGHPGGGRRLAEAGFTHETAGREGRLVSIETNICESCGGFYERRSLMTGREGEGCLPAMISGFGLSAAAGGAAWCWKGGAALVPAMFAGWFLGAYGAIVAHEVLVLGPARRRLEKAALPLADLACCADPRPVRLGSAGRARFPCPHCGERGVQFRSEGIS